MVAPTGIGFEPERLPGPYHWQNWRIGKLDVGIENYGAARDKADEMEAVRNWIMVPDGDPLSGQPYEGERGSLA